MPKPLKLKRIRCAVCHEERDMNQCMPGELISPPIQELIKGQNPAWTPDQCICLSCLDKLRMTYIHDLVEADRRELSALRKRVHKSLARHETMAQNINVLFERELTFGERVSDKLAEFGGSWPFIGTFMGILVLWVIINSITLLWKPFDPYPFIFLNLVLSCLAAIQAPIIMMSQNRQEAKDRLQAENDYRVNLKAELEVRHLHAKLDLLLSHQWQRLLEIQELQLEMMEELARRK